VEIVEDTLEYPNGIAFSPDQGTLYLSDSSAYVGLIDGRLPPAQRQVVYGSSGTRTLYAYNVSEDGLSIANKRRVYYSQDFIPNAIKVARNGYLMVAAGHGVDVIDSVGTLLVRIQTSHVVANMQWVGDTLQTLWLVGNGGMSKVIWNLQGPIHA